MDVESLDTLKAAVDHAKQTAIDPTVKTLLEAFESTVTAIRAERAALQEWGDGALTRVENMVKPFAEFIASVSVRMGK